MRFEDALDCALFLDLDGTLIDIAPTPDTVRVPDGLVPLLQRLQTGLGGALAIITGRPVSDIDRLLAPSTFFVAGVHGAEIRSDRGQEPVTLAAPLDGAVRDAVRRLEDIAPGIVIEQKPCSIAVHYRLAPAAEPMVESALRRILADGPDHLILCAGRKVIEIVPKRVSKGAALETFSRLAPFAGRRAVMIGDDFSDLSAFDAARRLGGVALRVAGELFSTADSDFDGPTAVRSWLAALATRLPP